MCTKSYDNSPACPWGRESEGGGEKVGRERGKNRGNNRRKRVRKSRR